MSKHYSDQAELYNTGKARVQWLHGPKIMTEHIGKLILMPED
jgi:hypothetical protein